MARRGVIEAKGVGREEGRGAVDNELERVSKLTACTRLPARPLSIGYLPVRLLS